MNDPKDQNDAALALVEATSSLDPAPPIGLPSSLTDSQDTPPAATLSLDSPTSNTILAAQKEEVHELTQNSFKLFSDYSILRGEFLKSPSECDNPNTIAFDSAGLQDAYSDIVILQERLIRLLGKHEVLLNPTSGDKKVPERDAAKDRAKLLIYQSVYDEWFGKVKSLREKLEDMHKNEKGYFVYKSGISFQLIGNPEVEPSAAQKKVNEVVSSDTESDSAPPKKRKMVPKKRPTKRTASQIDTDSESEQARTKKPDGKPNRMAKFSSHSAVASASIDSPPTTPRRRIVIKGKLPRKSAQPSAKVNDTSMGGGDVNDNADINAGVPDQLA